MRLRQAAAVQVVHQLWPALGAPASEVGPNVESMIARAADRMVEVVSRMAPATKEEDTTARTPFVAEELIKRVERQMESLTSEVATLRREMAQFAAFRNNLVTKLDDAVARTTEALSGARSGGGGGGVDPLVEARRDRDMGVLKSTMTGILEALERLEQRTS